MFRNIFDLDKIHVIYSSFKKYYTNTLDENIDLKNLEDCINKNTEYDIDESCFLRENQIPFTPLKS